MMMVLFRFTPAMLTCIALLTSSMCGALTGSPIFDFLEIIQFSHDVVILLSSIRNNFNCCIRHLLINKWPIQCQSILFLIKLVNQTSDPCI